MKHQPIVGKMIFGDVIQREEENARIYLTQRTRYRETSRQQSGKIPEVSWRRIMESTSPRPAMGTMISHS
jgi:hypothetical protein